ncbi:hypothetical protein [Chryseolinea lacunae]|uniref:Uncharacterized protein n=1 Tax=Chryseolinea lacunae TaxID=2801331 RepID=A0ABS1KSD0_9BACT|nr:hypothetical protein [Chryseolinea lacunae]MBL0741201.1 hypothetical protein [Chryseolinea lacunae]
MTKQIMKSPRLKRVTSLGLPVYAVLMLLLGILCFFPIDKFRLIPEKEVADFYDVVLGQIIYDKFYDQNLSVFKATLDSSYSKFRRGEITEEEFERSLQYYRELRMNLLPKATISFYDKIGVYERGNMKRDDKEETKAILAKDTLFQRDFSKATLHMLDSLFVPCGKKASEFNVHFMNVVEDKRTTHWFGDGGTLCLSKPVFNASGDKAILYCERVVSGKNGVGLFAFVEFRDEQWKVFRYKLIWQS